MRKKRLYWTLQFLGWTIYAVVNILLQKLNPQGNSEDFVEQQIIEILFQTPILFLVSHLVLRRISQKREWVKKDFNKIIYKVVVLILIMSISVTIVVQLVVLPLQWFTYDFDWVSKVLMDTLSFLLLYVFWASIYFLYHYLESNNKSLKFEAAVNEMQLNQLKSQLNPHFIFNALNSMRALVDENPSKAKIAITQLSNILRKSLIMDKLMVVDFNEELNTVKDYLALESIRFEERLRISYDIDKNAQDFQIPPMMMQTLVENAIKHGVSKLIDGGDVELVAYVKDYFLTIQIRNSGRLVNGVVKKPKQGGYGLANTKQRLKLIYGGEASFKIYNENDKFVTTEVRIPQRF
jgi:sensor histidine kinase YesM